VVAHRALIERFRPIGFQMKQVLSQYFSVERTGEPQGPGKRPATLRQRETSRIRMQVSPATWRRAPRIGGQGSLDRNDAQ
jgi:hypothetical protein